MVAAMFAWEEVSRELLVACDADGRVLWADSGARHLLGLVDGGELRRLALPGAEGRLDGLLAEARVGEVRDREVPLVVQGRPATLLLSARPATTGVIQLHGTLLPEAYGATVAQLNDAVTDAVALNREISRQRRQLEERHTELQRAYRHLDESNRAVTALHAEIADKADTLRQTAEVRGRVVANLSHELRTPLHAIIGLSNILLAGTDGPLSGEQRKQVTFIQSSANQLAQLVTDLLDLAKTESGTLQVRSEPFTVSGLFATFRGSTRPLIPPGHPVDLVVEAPADEIQMNTDQGKVAQILRNLVTNALKFTEQGEIRVTAAVSGDAVVFSVTDTGIGIAPDDLERIFEEFTQVDSHLQRRSKGAGLGLPLSRRLAEMLGGTLTVASTVGKGTAFTFTVPGTHLEVQEIEALAARPRDPSRAPVLVVEDDRKTIFVYEKYLALAGFQVMPARTIEEARELVKTRPSAIVLDIMLENETSWRFLSDLKSDPDTRDIPVLVVTVTNRADQARALGADEFWLKPVDRDRLVRKLRSLVGAGGPPPRLLLIDDDDSSRYLVRKLVEGTGYELREASTGGEGVALAREERPDVILLDFQLEEATAFDVLDELKADPRTRGIPVVIVTSQMLDTPDRLRLSAEHASILSKGSLTRELALNRIRDALRSVGGPRGG